MIVGIAEIVILGLLVEWLFRKTGLPGLIGLIFLGALIGPYALDMLNPQTQAVANDLRMLALIVILLRAGFEMSRSALARVGGRAAMMSFLPCLFEVAFVTAVAPTLLGITTLEAAILGSILGAVSPAVVVPLMIRFIEEGRGADKGAPTLVLAGASCDDAVAIVLSSSFIGMYAGQTVNMAARVAQIPLSIITGIVIGLATGLILYRLFRSFNPRATKRVLVLLSVAILMLTVQKGLEGVIPFAGLLAVMAIGFVILEKDEHMAHEISAKLGKVWVLAQLLLFTIIGAQVNVPVAIKAGLAGAAVIGIGLVGRSVGVQLCLARSRYTRKERLFIGISYLPKATVQAAIGAAPLAAMRAAGMNEQPGEVILAVAVLSIILTAPLGAVLISWAGRNLLEVTARGLEDSPAMAAALESEE